MNDNQAAKEALEGGNYFKKQFLCPSRLIGWSHRRRFMVARKLLGEGPIERLLDYGCGDGTFLVLNQDLFKSGVGVDVSPEQISENQKRLAMIKNIRFFTSDGLSAADLDGSCDIVTCMETLEHCTLEDRTAVLQRIRGLVKPGGKFIISVPIEIGLSLPVKQIIRRVVGWRKFGHYQHTETYTWNELWKMVTANADSIIVRPRYRATVGYWHGHKGFNYLELEKSVSSLFTIEQRSFSPIPFLGGMINSQVYLICRLHPFRD